MARTDASREHLLEAAARILAGEGLGAVTTRRLASEVGVSTMVVYTRFGSMPELLDALVAEGFSRLTTQLEAVPVTDDPLADLLAMADAYHANAVENPHLYPVMFGAVVTGSNPEEQVERVALGLPAFALLVDLVARAVEAGRLNPGDPAVIASQLFSAIHGFVMLEMGGVFAHDPASVDATMKAMISNLLVGLGGSFDPPGAKTRGGARGRKPAAR